MRQRVFPRRRVRPNDFVDFVAGCPKIPTVLLANEDQPVSRAALPAEVGSLAVLVVKPKAILSAAQRARPVLIDQKAGLDPELRQDFPPAVPRPLDRVVIAHAVPRSRGAKAM